MDKESYFCFCFRKRTNTICRASLKLLVSTSDPNTQVPPPCLTPEHTLSVQDHEDLHRPRQTKSHAGLQEALLGNWKELTPLRPEKRIDHYINNIIYYYINTSLSLIPGNQSTAALIPAVSAVLSCLPKRKVVGNFVVSGTQVLCAPEFCSLLQINWTCIN